MPDSKIHRIYYDEANSFWVVDNYVSVPKGLFFLRLDDASAEAVSLTHPRGVELFSSEPAWTIYKDANYTELYEDLDDLKASISDLLIKDTTSPAEKLLQTAAFWGDVDSIITDEGGAVTGWQNKSEAPANTTDPDLTVGAATITLEDSSVHIITNGAAEYGFSNANILSSAGESSYTGAIDIFLYYKADSSTSGSGNSRLTTLGDLTGTNTFCIASGSDSTAHSLRFDGGAISGYMPSGFDYTDYIVRNVIKEDGSYSYSEYNNFVEHLTESSVSGQVFPDSLYLNKYAVGSAGLVDNYYKEIIIFNRKLADEERALINEYLQNKYNL